MSAPQPPTPGPPRTLRLAQLSDLHLSPHAAENGLVLTAETGPLLHATLAALRDGGLDAVVLTGDLIDDGTRAELDGVIDALNALPIPWYAIPGNHDIAFPPGRGKLDRREFYTRLAARARDGASIYAGAPERGSWTALLGPAVRLIGLDSNVPGDWSGRVDGPQLAWLDATLAAAPEPLVVLLVHHPLHAVFGGWARPAFADQPWDKFFCANGAEVEALLDRYPAVRLVLTGHDHVSRVDARGPRLHFAAPALSSYPLAYRVVEVAARDGGWACAWQTHSPADAALRERALRQLAHGDVANGYDPTDPVRFAAVSAGRPYDQEGRATLLGPVARRGS